MLKKLIKYEWAATYKVCVVIMIVVAAMTLIGVLGMVVPFNSMMDDGNTQKDSAMAVFSGMMFMMTLLVYIFSLMGASLGTQIYLGINFYRSMYTDQGYITHTLPVTPKQLLISKTLVSGIWTLIMGIVSIISVIVLMISYFYVMLKLSGMSGLDIQRGLDEFKDIYREMYSQELFLSQIHAIISTILAVLVTPFSNIMILFGSLTIGQLSRKYKAFMGILTYLGCLLVNMFLTQIFQFIFTYGALFLNRGTGEFYVNTGGSYDGTLLASLVLSVPLCIFSHHILKNKLNLD